MLKVNFFAIEDRLWETVFFAKKWGLLKFNCQFTSFTDLTIIDKDLASLLREVDEKYELIEIKIPISLLLLSPVLENQGFRLVDSQIYFKTLITHNIKEEQKFPLKIDYPYSIRKYRDEDFNSIIELTDKCLIKDLKFVSRFKNPLFFTKEEAQRYFEACIRKSLLLGDTICAVLLNSQQQVKGYFIYEKRLDKELKTIYKGILAVIDYEARGEKAHLALQSYLFSLINDDEFYLDNTTQLSNIPVIKNHIKAKRTLEDISLIFMRKSSKSIHTE